jgi:hypothetical protein
MTWALKKYLEDAKQRWENNQKHCIMSKKFVEHQENAKRSQEEVGPNQINIFC